MSGPIRKRNRLMYFDYSAHGVYFITICTSDRKNLFWSKCDVGAAISRPPAADEDPAFVQTPSAVKLSSLGKMADDAIRDIPLYYPSVHVDHYVIMPNHIHLLLALTAESGRLIAAPTISRIIGQLKRSISRKAGFAIWQKSFHDHIVRDEKDYQKIWTYIEHNPWHWESDCFYNKSR